MRNRKGAGYVSAWDMEVLQACFDTLLARHHLDRNSADADLLASFLFTGHRQGITSQDALMEFAERSSGFRGRLG